MVAGFVGVIHDPVYDFDTRRAIARAIGIPEPRYPKRSSTSVTTTNKSLGVQSAAARHGLSTSEYLALRDAGLKWCRTCKEWRPLADYKPSTSTHDGVRPLCIRHYKPRPEVPIPHGRVTGYSRGCRCPQCRKANTESMNRRKAERCADPAAADRAGHGKASTYSNYGCRCEPCKAAQAEANRRNYQRRKQMTETTV